MIHKSRFVALVRLTNIHPSTRHSTGFPAALASTGELPEPMEWPRVLLIHSEDDGVFLDRYTSSGAPAGDTWHQSVEQAKRQAEDEYGALLSAWVPVPSDVKDEELMVFAETHAATERN
jgi:hypothetical protein